MMNLPLWMMLIGIIFLGKKIRCTHENDDFKNTQFHSTPGLFYEKLGPFQTIGGTLKVKITLGEIKCKLALKTFSEMLEKAMAYCKQSAQFICYERIDYSRLKNQIHMAANIRSRLLEAVEEISSKSHASEPEQNSRKKRQTLNNVTYSFEIEETTFDAFNDTDETRTEKNITLLIANQTLSIRSELERLNRLQPQIYAELDSLEQQLNQSQGNVSNELNEYLVYQKINLALSKASLALEKTIEEYIKYLETMISVVHSIQQNTIHPALFKRNQLIRIIQEFQKQKQHLEFPCTLHQANVSDVLRVSSLSFSIVDDELIVILDIPLLVKTKYHLYRLHQTCVTQTILNNGTGCAYMKPRTKFLVMDEQKGHYFHLMENILPTCPKIAGKYICHLVQAHYSVGDATDCEVQLLYNLSLATLQNCNIRVSLKPEAQWTAIVSSGGWLYSLPRAETAQVFCKNKTPQDVILENAGFLRLSPECSMRTETVTLPSLPFRVFNVEFINVSPIHLNLSEISTSLTGNYKSRINPIVSCPRNETDCSLLELESHMMLYTIGDATKYSSLFLITVGCVVTLVIILLIRFGGICWGYCHRRMCKGKRETHVDNTDNDGTSEEIVTVMLNDNMQANNLEVESGYSQRRTTKYSPNKTDLNTYV